MTVMNSISRLALVSALALGATHASADLADTWSLETEAHTFLEEEFPQEAFDGANLSQERREPLLTCAHITGGYNVRNDSCAIIGSTGNGGTIGVNLSRTMTCNRIHFTHVPGLGGFVASEAVILGACTGG